MLDGKDSSFPFCSPLVTLKVGVSTKNKLFVNRYLSSTTEESTYLRERSTRPSFDCVILAREMRIVAETCELK